MKRRREALRKVAPGYEPPEDDAVLSFADRGDCGMEGRTSRSEGGTHHRRSGILEPTRKVQQSQPGTTAAEQASSPTPQPADVGIEEVKQPRDVMDDLVEGLARMDELESKSSQ